MNNFKTQTSFAVNLEARDSLVITNLIKEETKYYNALVNNFAGASRTMTSTMNEMSEVYEELLGEVAASNVALRLIKSESIPDNLARFKSILFDGTRFLIDDRKMIFFEGVRAPANIPGPVRRKMAVEIFKTIRTQTNAIKEARNTSLSSDDDVYRVSMQTLTPHETYNKRHIQIPRNITKTVISEKDGTKVVNIYTPYSRNPIVIEGTVPKWSLLYLRKEDETRYTVDFRSNSNYDVFKRDAVIRKRRK